MYSILFTMNYFQVMESLFGLLLQLSDLRKHDGVAALASSCLVSLSISRSNTTQLLTTICQSIMARDITIKVPLDTSNNNLDFGCFIFSFIFNKQQIDDLCHNYDQLKTI